MRNGTKQLNIYINQWKVSIYKNVALVSEDDRYVHLQRTAFSALIKCHSSIETSFRNVSYASICLRD
jgi:hypothetical protein